MFHSKPKPPTQTNQDHGPYTLSRTTKQKARELTDHLDSNLEKALAIYHHLHDKIPYTKTHEDFRNAEQTYQKGGACAELSQLYIAMTREIGLDSGYTTVHVNHLGVNYDKERKAHACANIKIKKRMLVDLAQHGFNIKHRKYTHRNDRDVYQNYQAFTGKRFTPQKTKVHSFKLLLFLMSLVSAIAGSIQLYEIAHKNHLPQKTYRIIKKLIN